MEELRFNIRPSFEPMLSLRLLSVVEGVLRTYRLECEITGFAPNGGSWEVSVDTAAAEALLGASEAGRGRNSAWASAAFLGRERAKLGM